MEDQHKQKARVALLSVLSNSTLVVLKIVIGVLIGSVSVISEAIHSGVDLVAALIAWTAVRKSAKPADKEHPFGHGKIENASGTVEAVLILVAAVWIIYEAVHKLLAPSPVESVGWGVVVMLVSATANMLVSARLFKIGKQTESVALQADAWHLRTDVYTSAGVMVGLAVMLAGGWLLPGVNLQWIDPVAAILVAFLIVRAGYDLIIASARDLLDVSLPDEEQNWIRDYIAHSGPTVRGFHDLRTRKAGSSRFIELHLVMQGDMSVLEAHRVYETIRNDIKSRFPGSSVIIHIDPCDGLCKPNCATGCLIDEGERRAAR